MAEPNFFSPRRGLMSGKAQLERLISRILRLWLNLALSLRSKPPSSYCSSAVDATLLTSEVSRFSLTHCCSCKQRALNEKTHPHRYFLDRDEFQYGQRTKTHCSSRADGITYPHRIRPSRIISEQPIQGCFKMETNTICQLLPCTCDLHC